MVSIVPSRWLSTGKRPEQLETSEKFQITEPTWPGRSLWELLENAQIEAAAIELSEQSGDIYVYDVNTTTN